MLYTSASVTISAMEITRVGEWVGFPVEAMVREGENVMWFSQRDTKEFCEAIDIKLAYPCTRESWGVRQYLSVCRAHALMTSHWAEYISKTMLECTAPIGSDERRRAVKKACIEYRLEFR